MPHLAPARRAHQLSARRRPLRTLVMVAALPLTIGLAATATSAQAAPTPGEHTAPRAAAASGAAPVRVWAPEFMERKAKVDKARAVNDAKKYPLLVATKKVYTPYVNDMRAANPGLVLALYSNGAFARQNELATVPKSSLLKDARGNLVKHRQYSLWLANPADPGWVASRIALCRNGMAEYRYNGCLLDNIGSAPIDPSYVSAAPINPRTNKSWTESEWLAATTSLAKQVRAAIAPAALVGNSIGNGGTYFKPATPSSQLMNGLDFGMSEVFLRGGGDSVNSFPSMTKWTSAVRMLTAASSEGRTILACVKLWTPASATQQQQWLRFSTATFLMGADKKHRFYFSASESASKTVYDPFLATPIGDPTGAMVSLSSGAYQREFSNGIAIVNPSAKTVTVALKKAYKSSAGKSVTSVTLSPNDGALLTSS